ncbi:MAG: hypothetical protein IKU19_09315, partial [Clostridia bacterium]|nr:hypothetical protein [Clostridia bacterium]
RFAGKYDYRIENGKIPFPDRIIDNENLTWITAEITEDSGTITCYRIYNADFLEKAMAECDGDADKFRIINQGEVIFDEDGNWKLPDDILKYLKTDELFLLGVFDYVEILSAEDMENYERSITEAVELLNDITF